MIKSIFGNYFVVPVKKADETYGDYRFVSPDGVSRQKNIMYGVFEGEISDAVFNYEHTQGLHPILEVSLLDPVYQKKQVTYSSIEQIDAFMDVMGVTRIRDLHQKPVSLCYMMVGKNVLDEIKGVGASKPLNEL